jgi:hypothetical protein
MDTALTNDVYPVDGCRTFRIQVYPENEDSVSKIETYVGNGDNV